MLAVLILPGYGVISLACLKYKEQQRWILSPFLLCISISYALFAFVIVFARLMQFSYEQFSMLVWSYLFIAGCIVAFFLIRSAVLGRLTKQNKNLNKQNSQTFVSSLIDNSVIMIVVASLGLYHIAFGAYTEIPADVYFHIEKFQQILANFSANELKLIPSITTVIKQDALVWYHLLAWLALNSGASVGQMVQTASLVSQTIFLIAVYVFALRIFHNRNAVKVIASFAVILIAAHFGVSVFSFLRYYSFAPAMLAFIFYFSAIIVVLNVLQQRNLTGLFLNSLLWLMLLLAAILVHTQEAMFIAIHSCIIVCVFALALLRNSSVFFQTQAIVANEQSQHNFDLAVKLVALGVVIAFCIAYLFAHYQLVHFGNNGQRLLELGPSIGFLPKLAILNPSYQFIQVVTLWGVLVYALFFLYWQRYKRNLVLVSGMLVPAFTVFNPFFTDLFLRLTDSTVLWRFCFLIPIHYVAADLIVLYLRRIFSSSIVWHKVAASVALVAMFILLLPFKNGLHGLHYSRYPTWRAVEQQQSYQHLEDVLAVLSAQADKKEVLTDPVTGYVLSGFTQHINYRDKFLITPYSNFKRFHFEYYADKPLKKIYWQTIVD